MRARWLDGGRSRNESTRVGGISRALVLFLLAAWVTAMAAGFAAWWVK